MIPHHKPWKSDSSMNFLFSNPSKLNTPFCAELKKIKKLLNYYLFSLVHEENPAGPGIQIKPNQPIYIGQQMVFKDGRISKTHS